MNIGKLIGIATLISPLVALADDPPPQNVWTGKGQAGYVASQGNAQSKSANAAIDMSLIEGPWKHSFHLGGLYGESANVVAAERWDTGWQSDYSFTKDFFGFGALRYQHDMFSGFQYQASLTGGVGYNVFNSDDLKLSVQGGAGYRRLRPELLTKDASGAVIARDPQDAQGSAIVTLGLNYAQNLSKTTTLTDKLLVEAGSGDTLITNALALSVKMSTRFALSVGYAIQDNTKPPAGLKKIDSIETLNLVYSF